jgi:3-methylcrotonyl-CoA carboxylase alpha subunit
MRTAPPALSSVLVANRGEIALRVFRTARRLGLRCIAVYSDADADAPFVRFADEAHRIGPAPARESYLLGERILDMAVASGASCIHPGYGFLSENADFAEACATRGVIFVGPPASAIRAMGLKDAAKALAENAGVPVVPGYHGAGQDPAFLKAQAEAIGYPVLIKAVAGGGGKGMKRVESAGDFLDALESAQREARGAFGDARVLVEKYVLSPRHVEIQVFADAHGNVVHLFERDCSLQRRHQKVIEEAPAPGMSAAVRAAMGRAAVEAARAVGYVGAGTVEFIADGRDGLREDRFYFMEMNTRLQVEHPVTEAITGLDLVELQLRVAAGEPLGFGQSDLAIHGHAVEARLYAEDPERGFLPSTGKLWALSLPEGEGIRVDAGVEEGGEVTPFYDPMIAKVIAHGADRREALDRLAQALGRTLIAGPKTNASFLKRLCEAEGFRAGAFDTGFIDRNADALGAVSQPPDRAAIAAGAIMLLEERALAQPRSAMNADPWSQADGFALSPQPAVPVAVSADGEAMTLRARWNADGVLIDLGETQRIEREFTLVMADEGVIVAGGGQQVWVRLLDPLAVDVEGSDAAGGAAVKSPMHGKLIALFVKPGDAVEKGQRLAIVEAMKMEHVLVAPKAGVVTETAGDAGAQVAQGARIVAIGEAP